MKTKVIEVTNGFNYGKFLIGEFDTEWGLRSELPLDDEIEPSHLPLLAQLGWGRQHFLVLDLQTGEGAIFMPLGSARHDLNLKHQVWVCPMFEPFLTWLYEQPLSDIDTLPALVTLTEEQAPSALYGHRRGLPPEALSSLYALVQEARTLAQSSMPPMGGTYETGAVRAYDDVLSMMEHRAPQLREEEE